MNLIEQLNWRYAVKKFSSKKLPQNKLDTLLEAARLSPTSYGLQAMNILVVEDPEVRAKLREHAWNQSQITDASQLLVFCIPDKLETKHVDEYVDRIVKARNVPAESLEGFAKGMAATVSNNSDETNDQWASRQVYIALGVLLTSAAVEGVDACPMEGFDSSKFDEVLGLKEKGLKSVVLATVGYRAEDDEFKDFVKVRKSKEELYEVV